MPERAATGWARWLLVSVAVVVLDFASKAWITHAFAPGEAREITSFFSLVLVYNDGAAFSFLAGAGGWQRWLFTLLTVAISAALVVALRRPHASRVVPLALALVLGGALGNLWDRLTLGHVIDFLLAHWHEHAFPAFNVADSGISVGVALLIWESVWPRRQRVAGEEKP
jgi:signal peptidase II